MNMMQTQASSLVNDSDAFSLEPRQGAKTLNTASYQPADEIEISERVVNNGKKFPRESFEAASFDAVQAVEAPSETAIKQMRGIAPVPRITIHAFCESPDVISLLERASSDRLMSRASIEIFAGGLRAAIEYYKSNAAANLIIIESRAPNDQIIAELSTLAEYCDSGTRVMVIGYSNDIRFYRELMQHGVSEYVVAPFDVVSLVCAVSGIYRDSNSGKLGQIYAFVGTKGGVGSSTIAHNVSSTIARSLRANVVLADLDLSFGTAALNFNVDTNQGVVEAIQGAGRLDEVLFDRLLVKYDDHFSLLTAPATLDVSHEFDSEALSGLLEVAQANVPFMMLDVPHLWTSWARNALVSADEIIITAVPDLANLRNAKNLVDFLKQTRPNDAPPRLILNQVGMPKRPEIKPNDFARMLQIEPLACIPFDAQLFGQGANNGKMIADTSSKSLIAKTFTEIAVNVAGRKAPRKEQKSVASSIRALLGSRSVKI